MRTLLSFLMVFGAMSLGVRAIWSGVMRCARNATRNSPFGERAKRWHSQSLFAWGQAQNEIWTECSKNATSSSETTWDSGIQRSMDQSEWTCAQKVPLSAWRLPSSSTTPTKNGPTDLVGRFISMSLLLFFVASSNFSLLCFKLGFGSFFFSLFRVGFFFRFFL